ncbi:MAG TPA: proprotein convertase P-domain-containing protein [Candidatus Limnocylindria bacterium]|nr:proprotein convertase P-domain-containing protein [Candidatus Limnocylindria bacterium]
MRLRLAPPLLAAICLAARGALAVAPPFAGVTTTTLDALDGPTIVPNESSIVSLLFSDLPGEVVDVDVTLDLAHPTANELDVYLVSPVGTTVALTTDNGGGADDVFAGTVFDDQATAPDTEPGAPAPHVRSVTYTDFTPVGPLQPEGALGALFGDPAGGAWALVVTDDSGGSFGTLNGWSLTLTTISGVPPADTPRTFTASGVPVALPNGDAAGVDVPITVTGLAGPVLDLDVTVDVRHGRAADVDLYLTSPSGRRIELATDLGGENDDLWAGTTFDDDAPEPASDAPLPESGTPFAVVAPEGALGAFLGEPAAGTWTLTAADDAGGESGTLEGWSLRLTVPARCGNGVVDPGEQCDDGNGGNGDGCDADCGPSVCGNGLVGIDEQCDDGNQIDDDGCSTTCRRPELVCDDCLDNDGDGRTDLADPDCGGEPTTLRRVKLTKRGTLAVRGRAAPFALEPGAVRVVVSDAAGHALCVALPDAVFDGTAAVSEGAVGAGTLAVAFPSAKPGSFTLRGSGLDFSNLTDRRTLSVGVQLGGHRFVGRKGKAKR